MPSLRQKKVRNREAYSVSLPISDLFYLLFQGLSRTIYGDSEAKIWAPAPLWCAPAENRARPSIMGAGNVISPRDLEKMGGHVIGDFWSLFGME